MTLSFFIRVSLYATVCCLSNIDKSKKNYVAGVHSYAHFVSV